jgi:hypothetical protein
MSVPVLGQHWDPWQSHLLGFSSTDTIHDFGCAVTAVAMELNYYGGNTDPGDLNDWLKARAGFADQDEIVWGVAAGRTANVTYAGPNDWSHVPADLNVVNGELDNGYPAIAEVRLSGHVHYVVLTGRSGTTYYINDPWYGDSTTLNGRYGDPAAAIYGLRRYHGTASTHYTPPIGHIDSPLANATVSGTWHIFGWASDSGSGIKQVQLLLDGNDMGAVTYPEQRGDGNPGFHLDWDTTGAHIGTHTLTLHLVDNAGLTTDYPQTITVSRSYLLLKTNDDNTVHLISNGTRRAFPSMDCFNDWNQDPNQIQVVDRSTIEQYTWVEPIPHLITPDGIGLYWVEDGVKRHVMSMDVWNGMSFSLNDVVQVSQDRFNSYPSSSDLSAVEPHLIIMDEPLLPSPSQLYVGNTVFASFMALNVAAVGSTIENMVLAVRGPNQENFDFSPTGTFFLDGGNETTYVAPRSLPEAGHYTYFCSLLNTLGDWHTIQDSGLHPAASGSFDVLATDPVVSVLLAPNTVTGGSPSQVTINLGGAAPTGGVTVNITSSDTTIATVPASVFVPAGSASAVVTASTNSVSSATSVTISATTGNWVQQATLTVRRPTVTGLTLAPATILGGQAVSATVTLDGPAPPGGAPITISTDNGAAVVPASVTVPAGQTSAGFSIGTTLVTTAMTANISASIGQDSQSASLSILPIVVQSVTLTPQSVIGGRSVLGSVTLSAPAPSGGAVVTLGSSNTAIATLPAASVSIPAGSLSAPFKVHTVATAATATAKISATYNGATQIGTLTVLPAILSKISATPNPVHSGKTVTFSVSLIGPAPAGGAVVSLSSDTPAVLNLPSSITVPAGKLTSTLAVSVGTVRSTKKVIVQGTYLQVQKVNVVVKP